MLGTRDRSTLHERMRRFAARRRRDDAASAQLVAFVIGLGVFLLSTAVLASFAYQPVALSKPSDALLRSRAEDVLAVIAHSPGVPLAWGGSASSVDTMARLGLLKAGTIRVLDEDKFYALHRGGPDEIGPAGTVDYTDARATLGLVGGAETYNFQLRTYPVFNDTTYGTYGMSDWKVAYVGDYSGATENSDSTTESASLDSLGFNFVNTKRTATVDGDKYPDDNTYLRDYLVNRLSTSLPATDLDAGTLHNWFYRYDSAELDDADDAFPGVTPYEGNYAIGIGASTTNLEYENNEDFRTLIGYVDLSAWTGLGVAPRIVWREMVEGEGQNNTSPTPDSYSDYGVVEVSPDGTTWYTLNPSAADPALTRHPSVHTEAGAAPAAGAPDSWTRHAVDFGLCGAACYLDSSVAIAFTWYTDDDATTGSGWLIDDIKVQLAGGAGSTLFEEGFEAAYYDALVIGSGTASMAFTPGEVKDRIEDFVQEGGVLLVLGGRDSTAWLNPFLGATIDARGAETKTVVDPFHGFLTSPNTLNYNAYTLYGGTSSWDTTSTDFDMVVKGNSANDYVLGVSKDNPSWGGDGRIILTTYLPNSMGESDRAGFLANSMLYGRYGYLHLDFGPEPPRGTPVASATATMVIDRDRSETTTDYAELRLILYLWR